MTKRNITKHKPTNPTQTGIKRGESILLSVLAEIQQEEQRTQINKAMAGKAWFPLWDALTFLLLNQPAGCPVCFLWECQSRNIFAQMLIQWDIYDKFSLFVIVCDCLFSADNTVSVYLEQSTPLMYCFSSIRVMWQAANHDKSVCIFSEITEIRSQV